MKYTLGKCNKCAEGDHPGAMALAEFRAAHASQDALLNAQLAATPKSHGLALKEIEATNDRTVR